MTALPFPEPRWQTDRTVLRPYTPADEKAFLRLWSDSVVQRTSFVEHLSPTQTEQFLQRTIQAIASGSLFFTVVEEKERREFIGHVSLNFKPPSNRDAAVGIALKAEYRGRGFGTELMHWLITHGFREFGLNRISLTVLEDNTPALKMYKRIGFIDEGRNREANGSHGKPRVIICMGIIREEWDVRQGRKRYFT
ncbi:acyl-CoA N-acyltransferase [Lactarius deliciosus]|nr:acyl-CoA N-acyltransferase [Lactarius deliciosus]